MYRVSFRYLVKENEEWTAVNNLGHKGGFKTEQEASEWAISQKEKGYLIPLKLLVWDEDIQCFSTIKQF